jgi:hypothetical protein
VEGWRVLVAGGVEADQRALSLCEGAAASEVETPASSSSAALRACAQGERIWHTVRTNDAGFGDPAPIHSRRVQFTPASEVDTLANPRRSTGSRRSAIIPR